jgi:DNA invertase Pin-like site-specific DNA recombinase
MSDKIKPHHLERKAMLYVRQSSAYQVAHNRESRQLQYAMQSRLGELGWREFEFVDEDLGRSADGMTQRSGFERMVAEVSLGRVGAVAAWEVSRFARNSRDWQQLVEICRVLDVVLVDQDTVYTPRLSNDRLLLGLKGSLNEYELDLLRERSVQARREKARRGELIVIAPIGYRKTDEQCLEKDPDRRVQQAIRLVFETFLQIGTVRQTLMWFLEQGLKLPARRSDGETYWRRPAYSNVYNILTNPVYGGAYAYGKSEVTSHYEGDQIRRGSRRKARDQWLALIPDSHEGYIDWPQFEQVQRMISENVVGSGGGRAPKRGAALLSGLLRCRRCGRKLVVRYTGSRRDALRYCCERA